MSRFYVAQVNIAEPVEPLTSQRLADFMDLLAPVNATADAAPGFVWRLQGDDGDATSMSIFDDGQLIVNMSVWESLEAYADFVFTGMHVQVMRRRREWFSLLREPYTTVWWVPSDTRPTIADAEARLSSLRQNGPTPFAFTLKQPFPAPNSETAPDADPRLCPA
jgi:hypothetical protein